MTQQQLKKLTVWAPATPGAAPSIVGTCDSVETARQIAERFDSRRDLCMQDVFIRDAASNKIIERCGPAR